LETWKTLEKRTVLKQGKWLQVENHKIQLPDGQIIEDWSWIVTPDYINVLAVTEEGRFICFRQTKYAADGITLATVGGYIEPGEDPLTAAQRELLEETGYHATEWHDLGRYVVDGNRGAGTAHLFLAQNARQVQPIDADDLEEQELLMLSRAEIQTALLEGEFKVVSWATAVALGLLTLSQP
jgi:ADP-ribose pyrophosphatase